VEYAAKCHPETAECGIEYDQGLAKRHFRRNNLQNAQRCEEDAKKAYRQISLLSAKRTARKARTYMRAYADGSGESHLLIEKFVEQVKCHRNVLDMCKKELNELEKKQKLDAFVLNVKKTEKEMKKEMELIKKEKEDMKRDIENKKRIREEQKKAKEEARNPNKKAKTGV